MTISALAMGQAEAFFKAVQNRDISSITSLMMDEIELCIKDDQRIMSKDKAIKAIDGFLSSHMPSSVEPLHSGSSGKGSKYKVAKMTTKDATYRVFVYMEGSKIREVRFDNF